jgi:hypothetical protein
MQVQMLINLLINLCIMLQCNVSAPDLGKLTALPESPYLYLSPSESGCATGLRQLFKSLAAPLIQTDCYALDVLKGKLSNNARVVWWQLYLQSCNPPVSELKFVNGKYNCIADLLTRMGT